MHRLNAFISAKSVYYPLCRYAYFPEKHMQGIISHVGYNISPGMVEGFNNKIQTMRRKAYGFNDDEYFFLKIIDISKYV
ncbi:transposase [Ruminobacter sp. RM87]|uniref:transposase n=1 Tax=Ruminobacter sp. RM87 TaxID=1200567 RepID=UPI00055DEB5F|nr:transposase [Ruminobacter sp. RM87]